MAERSTCDLPYGHYGQLEYLPEEKRLVFGRLLSTGTVSRFIRQPGDINKLSLHERTSTAIPPSKRHAEHIHNLVRGNPELEPVAGHLNPLIRLSEAVQDAVGAHDPTDGDLVDFSRLRSKAQHRHTPVVATRAVFDHCTVILAKIQVQRCGWTDDRSTWFEVPTVSGEQTFWTSDSGIIRQLLFAHVAGRGETLLAVRLERKVVVLRASLERCTSLRSSSSSRMALHAVATIGAAQLSSKLPVDVAFNPWFPHQIAILDRLGGLHLWELSTSPKDRHVGAKLVASKDGHNEMLNDGWARVMWLSNLSTLLVSTRRNLQIIRIDDEKLVLLNELNLHLPGPIPWILDVSSLTSKLDSFVVLTTTHVLVYSVIDMQSSKLSLVSQLKVRHFWSPDNPSLRIANWVEQEDHVLALYSSIKRRLAVYRVNLRSTATAIVEEPFELTLPTFSTAAQSDHTIQTLHVQPVGGHGKEEYLSHRSHDALTTDMMFYNVFVVPRTGELEQLILYRQPVYPRSGAAVVPRSISWRSKLYATASTVQSVDRNEVDITDPHEILAEPRAQRARLSDAQKRVGKGHLDLEHLVRYLGRSDDHDKTIASAMMEVKSVLFGPDLAKNEHLQTLGQLFRTSVVFDDVASASAELEAGITGLEAPAQVEHGSQERCSTWVSAPIHLPTQTKLSDVLQGNTLSTICERLVANWITSLSTEVRGTARLKSHEVMRRTAIDLFLAAHVMQPSYLLEEEEHLQPDRQQSSDNAHDPIATWDLPVRPTRSEFHSMPSTMLGARDAAPLNTLPTPSPTATPSITTVSSNQIGAAPQLGRLKKYASFVRPTSFILPRALNNVLSHWDLGEDPYGYEWLARSRKVFQRDDDADQEMTEKERGRLQRRADRHIRRQRKEAAASQTAWVASSQAIDVSSARQPSASAVDSQTRHARSSQSHSQGQSQNHAEAIASQVLSERYGGRPPPKKRKRGF